MKAMTRMAIQYGGIILLVMLTCTKATAEPIEPLLSKDVVNNLIAQIKKSKEDKNLVNNLLDIALYYLSEGNHESEQYINRAFDLSERLTYSEGLVKSMCLKATFLQTIVKDSITAARLIEKAVSLSKKENIPEMQAYAYYTRGEWYGISNLPLAEEYYARARDLYKIAGNPINEAFVLKSLANTHYYQNNFSRSLEELFESLELYKNAQHPDLHYTYDLIGVVYKAMGNYEEALKYSLLTLKTAQKTKDTSDIALFHLRIGHVFKELNQLKEASQYYTKVLRKAENDGGSYELLRISASNISNILIQTGKPDEALQFYIKAISLSPVEEGSLDYCTDQRILGDIYYSLKQFDKAEKHYLQMLNTNEKNSFADYYELMSFLKLGDFYISQGQFSKAREYVDKATVQKSLKSQSDIMNLNLQLYKVDSAFTDYLSAIRHYQRYKAINDSMFNEKKSNQIASINIQYETEKKQQEIGTLTALNREQQVILEKRIFERNVFTGGAILLLSLLLVSVNRHQIKQKANKRLQEKQQIINKTIGELNSLLQEKEDLLQSKDKLIIEKEWLIKEVHHRVKNNLQLISALLYSQATYLKNKEIIAAINDGQQRIHAISLIHQKLYQSDNLQLVNMKSYVHELVENLKESFDTKKEIEFFLEIYPFEIGIIKAIPLGLILNEAITNSLKYAFCEKKRKVISIQLEQKENNRFLLLIKDNGKGMPEDFDLAKSDSLGISLMQGLSNQINAKFSIKNEDGTMVTLEFEDIMEPS